MKPLNGRQQRFVDEYLVDLNGAAAARRAGYSEASAASRASRLLKQAEVADAIENAKAERSARTKLSGDRVLEELARIGFCDVRRLFAPDGRVLPLTSLDDDIAACVSSLEVNEKPPRAGAEKGERIYKVRLWDKRLALVDLAKHLGLFKERAEESGAESEALPELDGMDAAARIAAILEAARVRTKTAE